MDQVKGLVASGCWVKQVQRHLVANETGSDFCLSSYRHDFAHLVKRLCKMQQFHAVSHLRPDYVQVFNEGLICAVKMRERLLHLFPAESVPQPCLPEPWLVHVPPRPSVVVRDIVKDDATVVDASSASSGNGGAPLTPGGVSSASSGNDGAPPAPPFDGGLYRYLAFT